MIHVAICDDEKYMSDMIRRSVSDFFRKKKYGDNDLAIFKWRESAEI